VTEPEPGSHYHVEVRQFPHVARAFNLSREQLEQRFLGPWAGGRLLSLDDRRFDPARGRLVVYEGPFLESTEMGLGRGWSNVTRAGQDVTARVLAEVRQPAPAAPAQSSLARFKQELVRRCTAGPLVLRDVVAIAGQTRPEGLVSERLALAERAVWELLHEGHVRLPAPAGGDPGAAGAEAWRATLLSWEAWATEDVWIEAVAGSHASA
jgi:hypothetical protein